MSGIWSIRASHITWLRINDPRWDDKGYIVATMNIYAQKHDSTGLDLNSACVPWVGYTRVRPKDEWHMVHTSLIHHMVAYSMTLDGMTRAIRTLLTSTPKSYSVSARLRMPPDEIVSLNTFATSQAK